MAEMPMQERVQEAARSSQESALPLEIARTQETARTLLETARTQRSLARATLQPTVHDFNGNIINKAIDEDQTVWMVGKSHSKVLPATDYAYPVPAGSFRGNGAFSPLHWESARLPLVPTALRSDRTAAWTEEVHRRHVARTARARARLSPKQRMADRVIPTTPQGVYEHSDSTFSLSLPANGDNFDDFRLTNLSRLSSKNDNSLLTARSRPATTGRYFDTSNGLRNLRSNPAVLRSRPNTASQWSGPGLKIKKLTLHQKELMVHV